MRKATIRCFSSCGLLVAFFLTLCLVSGFGTIKSIQAMQELIFRAKTNSLIRRLPRVSLGVVPMLISFELGVSMIIGYFIARFCAGAKTNMPGRIPSFLVFRVRSYRVHLHHWFVFSNILAVALVLHFFVITPLVFYGFLGGVIAQGVLYYNDWGRIVTKA